jgi:hypothetical protein
VGQAINPNRGGAVTPLTAPHLAGDTLYATREGVESQRVVAIEMRYKVAWGAPILQDMINDLSLLADLIIKNRQLKVVAERKHCS